MWTGAFSLPGKYGYDLTGSEDVPVGRGQAGHHALSPQTAELRRLSSVGRSCSASSHQLKFIFQKKLDQGTVVIATVRVTYTASFPQPHSDFLGSDFSYAQAVTMAEPRGVGGGTLLCPLRSGSLNPLFQSKAKRPDPRVSQSSPSPESQQTGKIREKPLHLMFSSLG